MASKNSNSNQVMTPANNILIKLTHGLALIRAKVLRPRASSRYFAWGSGADSGDPKPRAAEI